MKIEDLKDRTKVEDIDLKIIYDKNDPKEIVDRNTNEPIQVKSVCVANIDSEKGDGRPTAWLDLVGSHIGKYKFKDKIKVHNAWAKKMNNGQFYITNVKKIQLIGDK